jgi:hypothetical protein
VGGFGKISAAQELLAPNFTTWFTGRALHRGFLSETPSKDTTGALFESWPDGMGVSGGWREDPASGGAPLAALTSAAALPLEMAALPYRMADAGLTARVRLLEAVAPAARPGPESK